LKTAFISDTRRQDDKQFGFLIYSTNNLTGNSKEIIFLKDDISRCYPEGTLVTFELQTRKVTYDKPTVLTSNKERNFKAIDEILSKDLRLVEIEVATKVRAVEEDREDGGVGSGEWGDGSQEISQVQLSPFLMNRRLGKKGH
jgi:hypothetical protein